MLERRGFFFINRNYPVDLFAREKKHPRRASSRSLEIDTPDMDVSRGGIFAIILLLFLALDSLTKNKSTIMCIVSGS